jgi:hypothetical protein
MHRRLDRQAFGKAERTKLRDLAGEAMHHGVSYG